MKLTTKGRYGLRAMIELAMNRGNGPTMVDTIAKNQNISAKYIHVLMTSLRNSGLVHTTRGPNGGYKLVRAPEDISVLEIIESLEGKSSWMECVHKAGVCPKSAFCAARELWSEIADSIETVLSNRTLADLARRQEENKQEVLMFHI